MLMACCDSWPAQHAMCKHQEQCRRNVASPTDRPSLKSFENRLGITYMSDLEKIDLVYSEKFSQQKPWKCKIQHPKTTKNHTKLPTFLGGHPSKLGDIPTRNLLGITMNHIESPYACSKYKVPKPSIDKESLQRILPKSLHPMLQPRLSASSFNSLMDLSWEALPQVFHVSVVSVWWHRQAVVLTPKWKHMHHVNLCPFCTGHLPTSKQQRPLPARHCSWDALACSSTLQGYKDLTRKYSQHMQTESKSCKRTTVFPVLYR